MPEKTHFLGIMVTAKNEGMVIKEWIEHYLWQGVDHIYFIDNDSTDNTAELLKPYVELGIVTYYYKPQKYAQVVNYKAVFPECKKECEWLMIIDMDEYVYARKSGTTIASVLRELPNVNCIQLNWRLFGSSGFKTQPESIRTSFTRSAGSLHELDKSIFRADDCVAINVHSHTIRKCSMLRNPEALALNHYPIMSWEYFSKTKIPRGDVIHAHHEHTRDEKYFARYDSITNDIDNFELAELVKEEKAKLTLQH